LSPDHFLVGIPGQEDGDVTASFCDRDHRLLINKTIDKLGKSRFGRGQRNNVHFHENPLPIKYSHFDHICQFRLRPRVVIVGVKPTHYTSSPSESCVKSSFDPGYAGLNWAGRGKRRRRRFRPVLSGKYASGRGGEIL